MRDFRLRQWCASGTGALAQILILGCACASAPVVRQWYWRTGANPDFRLRQWCACASSAPVALAQKPAKSLILFAPVNDWRTLAQDWRKPIK